MALGNNESYCPSLVLFAFQCTHAQTSFWATWLIILYIYTAFVFKRIITLYRHDLIYKPGIPKAGNGPGEFLLYDVLLRRESTWDSERASSFFFGFLGLHLRHMEVPKPGVQSGATAAGLRHSYSNSGSKPHLRPTPQLTATPDP